MKISKISNHFFHRTSPSIREGVLFLIGWAFFNAVLFSQTNLYQLSLQLKDSVVLNLPVKIENQKIIIPAYPNAIKYVEPFEVKKDSVKFSVSIYENVFLLKATSKNSYSGEWIKYSSAGKQYHIPVKIFPHTKCIADTFKMRTFPKKWKIQIENDKTTYNAVGTFRYYPDSDLSHLSGSIATPYGDLGNLNGYIRNDSLYLSVFNGSFATQIIAKIFKSVNSQDSISGFIYYGNWGVEKCTGIADNKAYLNNEIPLQDIFSSQFVFKHKWKDIYDREIQLETNKPFVLLIMGTWCPNCADENKLFSNWYDSIANKVQIIALSVERTNDKQKAIEILKKYQKKINIPYPIVLLSESGTQKSYALFPEMIKIPAFPTAIYFDKQHRPYKATIGFNGPSTHELYLQSQEHIRQILNEITQQ
ncbi:MAG: hypothetical protein KatS3mg027_1526 [Bacteroidia bacterium]|nr:MAG: hypothetical protein KatS3mg027_1526 [Bacteroidia bacterium]